LNLRRPIFKKTLRMDTSAAKILIHWEATGTVAATLRG